MSHARLLSIEVANFKSYQAPMKLDLKPLTVLVGRNNSGKSTLVQVLSLLKQTLDHPRADVPLNLVGVVEALNPPRPSSPTRTTGRSRTSRTPRPAVLRRW